MSEGPEGPDLEQLLAAYLDPPVDPNPAYAGVEIDWVDDDPRLGSLHMLQKHGVTKAEVEQVLFEIPPCVEAKRSRHYPGRTVFWGATRADRWLIVVCEDWKRRARRLLKPITAFEPEDGERYWRAL